MINQGRSPTNVRHQMQNSRCSSMSKSEEMHSGLTVTFDDYSEYKIEFI